MAAKKATRKAEKTVKGKAASPAKAAKATRRAATPSMTSTQSRRTAVKPRRTAEPRKTAVKPRKAAVKAIPDGYHSATPYLIVRGGAAAIQYYGKAFGATELMRITDPSGKLGHAEIKVGNSILMLADEFPEMEIRSPQTLGGTGTSIMLYVEKVDSVFARALAAGGKELRPVLDQFYGDRSGTLEDPFGHQWTIATHTEDVSREEMAARVAAYMKQQAGG